MRQFHSYALRKRQPYTHRFEPFYYGVHFIFSWTHEGGVLYSYVRTGTSVQFFSAVPPRCASTGNDSDDVGESGMRFLITEVNSATTLRYTNQACSGSCWSASKRLRRKTLSCRRSPVCLNMLVHTPVFPFAIPAFVCGCLRICMTANVHAPPFSQAQTHQTTTHT